MANLPTDQKTGGRIIILNVCRVISLLPPSCATRLVVHLEVRKRPARHADRALRRNIFYGCNRPYLRTSEGILHDDDDYPTRVHCHVLLRTSASSSGTVCGVN